MKRDKPLQVFHFRLLPSDHLLRDRPKFRMALELPTHERGTVELQGSSHRQLLLRSLDCVYVDRALHLDERTSH
jgi:hypothetical protein